MLLVKWASTHRVGKKTYFFPEEFCQAEENIVTGGHSWWGSNEIEFLYIHDITSNVGKYDIPSASL